MRIIQQHGFIGILLLASWPNAAFDLCGICCGAFKMPFWSFFGATLIGKGGVKVSGQALFFVALFRQVRGCVGRVLKGVHWRCLRPLWCGAHRQGLLPPARHLRCSVCICAQPLTQTHAGEPRRDSVCARAPAAAAPHSHSHRTHTTHETRRRAATRSCPRSRACCPRTSPARPPARRRPRPRCGPLSTRKSTSSRRASRPLLRPTAPRRGGGGRAPPITAARTFSRAPSRSRRGRARSCRTRFRRCGAGSSSCSSACLR